MPCSWCCSEGEVSAICENCKPKMVFGNSKCDFCGVITDLAIHQRRFSGLDLVCHNCRLNLREPRTTECVWCETPADRAKNSTTALYIEPEEDFLCIALCQVHYQKEVQRKQEEVKYKQARELDRMQNEADQLRLNDLLNRQFGL